MIHILHVSDPHPARPQEVRVEFWRLNLQPEDSTVWFSCRSCSSDTGQIFKVHLELIFNVTLTARSSLNLPHLQNMSQHHVSNRGHDWSTISTRIRRTSVSDGPTSDKYLPVLRLLIGHHAVKHDSQLLEEGQQHDAIDSDTP